MRLGNCSKTFKISPVFKDILLIYSAKKTQIETTFLSVLHLLVLNKHDKFDVDTVDSFEIWNCNRCGGKKERKKERKRKKNKEEKEHDGQKQESHYL